MTHDSPFGNQLGGLQRLPITQAHRVMPQIASQYLSALLAYQYDREAAPLVFDITSSQYYLSDALCLINYLTSNPDAAVTVAKHPRLLTDVVEKILAPGFEERMRAAPRNMGSTTFEGDLGTVLQFVSTLLLCPDHIPGKLLFCFFLSSVDICLPVIAILPTHNHISPS